jgi:WD40 repeat protein
LIVTVGKDGVLNTWEAPLNLKESVKAHKGAINSVSLSSDNQWVATGGQDKELKIWNSLSLASPNF